MIVLDASAMLELLLATPGGASVRQRIASEEETLHTPHLLDLEVIQVLRRYTSSGALSAARARLALDDLQALDIERYPHQPLVDRIWQLRSNVTAYDAAYLAVAEALRAPLLTFDARLASSTGHGVDIELFD